MDDAERARREKAERAMADYLAQNPEGAEKVTTGAPATQPRPASTVPAVPAGWYPHPSMADTQRYWDGAQWTDHVAPGAPARAVQAQHAAEQEKSSNGLITAGVIMGIVFPIGGFVAGCVLLGRKALAGAMIMTLSVVSAYGWYDVYTSHQRQQCLIDNLSGSPIRDCG